MAKSTDKKKNDTKADSKAEAKKAEAKKSAAKKATTKATAKPAKKSAAVPAIAVSKAATQTKTERIALLELALRDTEAKLVDAEHHLARVQQELEGERQLREDAANATLAEAAAEEAALQAETAVEVVEIETVEVETVVAAPAPVKAPAKRRVKAAVTPPLPTAADPAVPSLAWTLVQLRTEAKTRGLRGYSTLTKPGLVALLGS